MTIFGFQSFGRFRTERRLNATHGWAPEFDEESFLLLMRTLGISRGHISSDRVIGLNILIWVDMAPRSFAFRSKDATFTGTLNNCRHLRTFYPTPSDLDFIHTTSHICVCSRAFSMLPLAPQKLCKTKAASCAKSSAPRHSPSTFAAALKARHRS